MSWETTFTTISSRFKTEVVDKFNSNELKDRVAYDNAPMEKGEPKNKRWVRFTVLPGDENQTEMGKVKSFRLVGVAIAQIFVPKNKGDQPAIELADFIRLAFRAKSQAGVTFKAPRIEQIGLNDKSEWQINVVCPFFVTEQA